MKPAFAVAMATLLVSPVVEGYAQDTDSSLTIVAAVRQALAVHPGMRAAEAATRQASARVGEFTADRFPSLAVDGSLMRYQEPMLVAPIHALDATQVEFNQTLIQGAVRLGYTLWDGGARGAAIDGARTREAVAWSQYDVTAMDVTMEVADAYLRVLSASEMLAAHDDGLAALRVERDRAQRLFAEGAAAAIEVLRAEAAIADAEAERATVEIELENAQHHLARVLGIEPEGFNPQDLRAITLRDESIPNRDTVAGRSSASNLDLQLASRAVDAATWRRKAATSSWFPRLDLIGGYLLFGSAAGNFTAEWNAGLRVSYPLFVGGRRNRAVDAASADVDAAQHRYDAVVLRIDEAVDRAVGAARELRARVRALTRSVEHTAEIARIEQLAIEAGSGTQAEFLRAQASLRRARALLAQTRHREIASRINLARLAGELDVAWLERELESIP